jgi:hypothetical protein
LVLNLVHVDDEKAAEYGEFMHKQGQKFFDFGEQGLVSAVSRISEQQLMLHLLRCSCALPMQQ